MPRPRLLRPDRRYPEVGPAEDASREASAAPSDAAPEPAEQAGWHPLVRVFFVLQEQEATEPGSSFGDQLLVRLPGKAPASDPAGSLVAIKLDLVVRTT